MTTVRRMRFDDIDDVLRLERQLFSADAWSRPVLEKELGSPLRHYIVVEKTYDRNVRKIIAYAGLLIMPPEADIQTIGVMPKHEGQGFGALMLQELIDEASKRGVEYIMLEVRYDNKRAQRLYKGFGFELTCIRKQYYSNGADAKVMRKIV